MATKLKSTRAGQRGATTKLLQKFEERWETEETRDTNELETLLETLKEKQELIRELDRKILDDATEEDIEKEILEGDEYNFNLDSKIRKFRKLLLAQTSALNASAQSFTEPSNFSQTVNSVHNFTENSHIQGYHPSFVNSYLSGNSANFHKLPKIDLPKFDGSVLEWQSFWDSFDSAIHSNSTLSEVQKFNYLKSLLEGEASNTIAGFALTHTNYVEAVDLLHERFGQRHRIIQSYMQALLDMPTPRNTLANLRCFYDRIESYVRGLEALGQNQETYGSLLVPVILNKLPSEMRRNLTREHGSTNWMLSDLRRGIYKELNIMEAGSDSFLDATEDSSATAAFYTRTSSYVRRAKDGDGRQKSVQCAYCTETHFANECTKYRDRDARMDIVKRGRLCFNCLGKHRVADCKSKSNCRKCNKRHHTSLCNYEHDERAQQRQDDNRCVIEQSNNAGKFETSVFHSSSYRSHPNVLLKTAVAPVSFRALTTDANILFDEGAQRSFISRNLANKLELKPTGTETISLSGFGDAAKETKFQRLDTATLKLRTIYDNDISVDVLIVPEIAAPLKSYVHTASKLPYLRNLRLAHAVTEDDTFRIELLIGADQYWNIVEDEVIRGEGPTAVKSKVGYLLSGPVNGERSHSNASVMKVLVSHKTEEVDIEKFWKIETTGTEKLDKEMPYQQEFHLEYEKSSIRYHDNRYYVKLPWKEDHPTLPLNQNNAYRRTIGVIRRLEKEPEMLKAYGEVIAEQERRGFIERVDSELPNDKKVHFIPHFPVKKDSTTTPIRIVYDCSCRETPDAFSLNDCLMNIPPNLNEIAAILLRFRLNEFAVTTDIEKAFLNVGLEEEDRDVTRFFWFNNPTDATGQLVNYRFKSVLFGATCSPFILNAVLMKHLKESASTLTERLTKDLYVDNIISSFPSENEVINFYNRTRPLFANAGFNLRSWASNSDILEEHAKKDNVLDNNKDVKILGLKWNVEDDTLSFTKHEVGDTSENITTKRDVLKQSSKIYDPLGIISPVTVKAKMFIQGLWKQGLDWDEKLSPELMEQWTKISDDTKEAVSLKIQRKYIPGNQSNTTLHIFTDASAKAYGACAYIVAGNQSSLIMAKNRIATLKTITMPKLELMGSLIGARLLNYIEENINVSNAFLWTDSQIVLNWLETTKPLGTFVRNRVQEIKEIAGKYTWKYCPTTSNPADLLSRGTDYSKLLQNDLWLKGPSWITDESKWPVWNRKDTHILANVTEAGKSTDMEDQMEEETSVDSDKHEREISKIIDISRYSTYKRLLNVTSYVLRFLHNCKRIERRTGPLDVAEIEESSLKWIRDTQHKHFQEIVGDLQRTGSSKH